MRLLVATFPLSSLVFRSTIIFSRKNRYSFVSVGRRRRRQRRQEAFHPLFSPYIDGSNLMIISFVLSFDRMLYVSFFLSIILMANRYLLLLCWWLDLSISFCLPSLSNRQLIGWKSLSRIHWMDIVFFRTATTSFHRNKKYYLIYPFELWNERISSLI